MKKNFTLFVMMVCFIISKNTTAQTNKFPSSGAAGIGTTTPSSSSLLEIKSTNKGLLIPRMTQTQRNAITSPATGLLIYQTNATPGFYYYDGTAWKAVSSSTSSTEYWKKNGNKIYYNAGNVGIGTSTPTAGLNIINDGGIIAKGDTLSANNYTLAETGTGSKFIWYPKRGALRFRIFR